MPSGPNELEWINLTDFTPGIFDDYLAGGLTQPAPDGSAQLTGTYSCVASPSGGLMAGPKNVQTLNQGLIVTPSGANQYMTNDAFMHCLAFKNFSPVAQNTQGAQGLPAFPDQPWIAWSYFLITNSPTNTAMDERCHIRAYFAYLADNNGVSQYPFSNTNPAVPNIYNALLHVANLVVAAPLVGQFPHGIASIDNSRSNKSTPTSPGNHITAMNHASGNSSSAANAIYPNNATPGTDSVDTMPLTANAVGSILSHQGRILAMRNIATFGYGTNGFAPPSEILDYTNVNDYSHATTSGLIFVEEHPTGYGSWISMNANQLMLVKNRGGAVSVTGPVDGGTITYLPGVPSTLGAMNIGCIPYDGGYIYGTTRGVYEWYGGDAAQLISPQIDGWFWNPFTDKRYGQSGSFAFVNPFVFAPNNFLYDTRTKGWWRLNLPSASQQTYAFWDTSANGLALGCGATVSATQTAAVEWYDTTQGQSSWHWKSQPLKRAMNRIVAVREVVIEASIPSGSGTIQIQTLDIANNVADDQTITVNTTYPVAQRIRIDVQCYGIVVNLVATGTGGVTAPRLESLNVGFTERMALA